MSRTWVWWMVSLAAVGCGDEKKQKRCEAARPLAATACDAGQPFYPGGSGATPFGLVGDFTLPTTAGDWHFADERDGTESIIFVLRHPSMTYSQHLWEASVDDLLRASPTNVRYFFLSYAAAPAADLEAIRGRVDDALGRLSAGAEYWAARFHYVTESAGALDNWIGEMVQTRRPPAFAIDRFQRLREVGLLYRVGESRARLSFLAHEVRHYNFECQREQILARTGVTAVPIFAGETVSERHLAKEVTLPAAAALARFDTVEIDLSLRCPDHRDAECPEWDRIVSLFLCDRDDPETCDTELGRWITTYGREGRWITPASHLLPLLKGGARRFSLFSVDPYDVSLTLRFFNRCLGVRPTAATRLFSARGTRFDAAYSDTFAPVTVSVPAGAQRAEVVALITGHGWGAEVANCAEFCNHAHHFTVGELEVVKAHPEAGTAAGCIDQIERGVVPNQFGTWPLGRGGWCPGLDVAPWVADVTEAVTPGGEVTVSYRGSVDGAPYVPVPSGSGDYWANIFLSSWIVFYE